MRNVISVSILSLLLPLLVSASPPLSPLPRLVLPQRSDLVGRTVSLRAGDTLLSAKAGWVQAAVTQSDIDTTVDGNKLSIPRGSIFVRAGNSSGDLTLKLENAVVFCGQRSDINRGGSGLLGIVATKIAERRATVYTNPKVCFADTDNDGKFDLSILQKNNGKNLALGEISPLDYVTKNEFPAAGNSSISLIYRGVTLSGNHKFALVYRSDIRDEPFLTFNSMSPSGNLEENSNEIYTNSSNLPQDIKVIGSKFTVISYEKSKKQLNVRINQDFEKRAFGLKVLKTLYVWY